MGGYFLEVFLYHQRTSVLSLTSPSCLCKRVVGRFCFGAYAKMIVSHNLEGLFGTYN